MRDEINYYNLKNLIIISLFVAVGVQLYIYVGVNW